MNDYSDYVSNNGTVSFWSKDGMWHIARPCDEGYQRWTDEVFAKREDAITALEGAS
jgi:hypothetical protein